MVKVLTTGTFDIVHRGHINILKRAKELGDYLIVGLNTTKNGKDTYLSYEDRKAVLEAIKYVDEVVPIEKQEDKYKYIKQCDIFTIGTDYVGHEDMKEISKMAQVVYIERTPDISSSQIKTKISDNTKYNTIVIDIDDTICYTENRDFKNSIPNQPVIDKINKLYDDGWKILLLTARGGKSCSTLKEKETKYRKITEKWLKDHNVKYHTLMFGKPNADYYVDDKNISVEEFVRRRKL